MSASPSCATDRASELLLSDGGSPWFRRYAARSNTALSSLLLAFCVYRSEQRCYLCPRSKVLPMSPIRTGESTPLRLVQPQVLNQAGVTPQVPASIWPGSSTARPHSGWLKASEPQVIGSIASARRRWMGGSGSPE